MPDRLERPPRKSNRSDDMEILAMIINNLDMQQMNLLDIVRVYMKFIE